MKLIGKALLKTENNLCAIFSRHRHSFRFYIKKVTGNYTEKFSIEHGFS